MALGILWPGWIERWPPVGCGLGGLKGGLQFRCGLGGFKGGSGCGLDGLKCAIQCDLEGLKGWHLMWPG